MVANKVEIRKYQNEMSDLLANIRQEDLHELQAICDAVKISTDTYSAILVCSCCQNNWSIYHGDTLLACCGVLKPRTPLDLYGHIWFLTTNAVESHKKSFVEGCKGVLAKALGKCPNGLSVDIIDRYKKAHRLARSFGFQPTEEVDFYGTKFIRYVLLGDK